MTVYNTIFHRMCDAIDSLTSDGTIDQLRNEELRALVSDWLFDKEREDEEIRTSALDKLFSWGNEADQGEAMERAGVVFSSEKLEGIVL